MSEKWYVLFISAEGCGACIQFKTYELANFEKLLAGVPNVELKHLKFESLNGTSENDKKLMNDIMFMRNVIYAFPSFLVITQNDFNAKSIRSLRGIGFDTFNPADRSKHVYYRTAREKVDIIKEYIKNPVYNNPNQVISQVQPPQPKVPLVDMEGTKVRLILTRKDGTPKISQVIPTQVGSNLINLLAVSKIE